MKDIKYYTLKEGVSSVGAKKNRIIRSTDEDKLLPETLWNPGTAEELVKKGFLVPVDGPAPESKQEELPPVDNGIGSPESPKENLPPVTDANSSKEELKENVDAGSEKEADTSIPKIFGNPFGLSDDENEISKESAKPSLEEISTEQLITELTEKGISFDANSSKEELYKLWINS